MTEDSILLAQLKDIPEAGAMEWKCEVPELISIILYKLNGQVFAYRNTCPHQGRPLGLGKVVLRVGSAFSLINRDNWFARIMAPYFKWIAVIVSPVRAVVKH